MSDSRDSRVLFWAVNVVKIGQYNPRYSQDYKSNKVKKAKELISQGQKLIFITKDEFLELTRP
jgi:hypothetical protein